MAASRTVNQQLAEDFTRHRLWLLRYESGTVREVVESLSAATGPLRAAVMVLRRIERTGRTRLTTEERAAWAMAQRAYVDAIARAEESMSDVMRSRLNEVRDNELRIVPSRIQTALPAAVEAAGIGIARVPASDALVSITSPIGGLRWTDRLARDLVDNEQAVRAAIADSVTLGSSIPNTSRLLRDLTRVEQTYRGRFEAIARTEVQRVASESAMTSYQLNADVVKGVQFLATLDSRTCPVCAPRHMAYYPMGPAGRPVTPPDGSAPPFIAPPIHPRCRCFLAPVTKSWRELGIDAPDDRTRRRLDGNRAENMNYDQWLRRQPKAVQVEVLGRARANLWRSGVVKLADLSDRGRTLSLGELAAMYDFDGSE